MLWFNRRWYEYCGKTPAEMAGDGWQSVHDPERLPEIMDHWKRCVSTGQPTELTTRLRSKDGAYRSFLTRVEPEINESGDVAGWCGISIDVTERIEAEAKLLATNAQLQAATSEREAMLRQLTDSVIVTDALGQIKFVNDAATKLHGVARLDVAPEDYSQSYSLFTMDGEAHPTDTLPLTRAVRNQETVLGAHWRIRRPDGSEVLAIGNAQPFYGKAGDMLGAVLTIHDDTARFAAEQAALDSARSKTILLQEVNHRVKNSLQLVASMLRLQAQSSNSAELKHSLDEATSRVLVIARMHRLLYQTETYDQVELTQYLSELAKDLVNTFNLHKNIALDIEAPLLVSIAADQAIPLALIVSELLTNALKYAFVEQGSGVIRLTIRNDGDAITVVLADNGRGLPVAFDTGAATTLGLRIVNALTSQIGARLNILELKKGAGFQVTIPVHPDTSTAVRD